MKTIKTAAVLGATLLAADIDAQNAVWNLDKTHSSINFSVEHMMVSETSGQFNDFSISAKSDKEDLTDAKGELVIQVSSIDTKDAKRDGHLKSADFFDAEKFPAIKFELKEFSKIKDKEYKVVGNLTMHGVTRSVTLAGKFGGIIKDPYGNIRTGIKVSGEIDRYDFGLKYNSVMDAGGLMIGKKVSFNANIEMVKAKA